jgi:hypothetical protein
VSDFRNGNIYSWDDDAYDDAGTPLISRRDGFHISRNGDRISCGQVQIKMQAGLGLASGADNAINPTGTLRVSKDYGNSYGPIMRAPLGKIGQYLYRVLFNRIGSGWDFVFSFSISDPVPRVIIGFEAIGKEGPF